jgi:signal transduction histidine kinase
MSSPAWHKRIPITSLYYGVLLAMVLTWSLSFLVFRSISGRYQKAIINPVYDRFDELELESARGALQNGGTQELDGYLRNLDRVFGDSTHYLLDAHGKDLISGENRANLIPPPPADKWRTHRGGGHWIISHRSSDGQYWFAAVGEDARPPVGTLLDYYFLVIGATALLCWLAAFGVISPIRKIAATIALFGQGNLSVRVHSERGDEIGQLGRSFDQMAERLERLIVSERRLLADISHEIRSPLARLKFAVKLARTSTDWEAALNRVERDVNRLTSLVADIVSITFIEGDPAVQGASTVQLRPLLDDVIDDCNVEAEARGCRIELKGQLTGEVLGNPELLRRAFENVIRNAIRYSPAQAAILVSVSEDAVSAYISVRDYGPGVPNDTLTRIFDPFYRVEEARDSGNGGGTGLGLSIAKRAVQVHHGSIAAENTLPGLRVEITLPLLKQTLLH